MIDIVLLVVVLAVTAFMGVTTRSADLQTGRRSDDLRIAGLGYALETLYDGDADLVHASQNPVPGAWRGVTLSAGVANGVLCVWTQGQAFPGASGARIALGMGSPYAGYVSGGQINVFVDGVSTPSGLSAPAGAPEGAVTRCGYP